MDIAILWDGAHFRGDWSVTTGDLVIDPGGLRSAVLLSLFTDRVAPDDYVPPAGSQPGRRGWWADSYEDSPIGSLLWLLDRSKKDGDTTLLSEAQDYCREALQWLVDAGIVATVTTAALWQKPDVIGLSVTLTQPSVPPATFNFDYAWRGA